MLSLQICPECGAAWQAGMTCEIAFHQMLYWENEDSRRGSVHHLMVLAYHLQHPSLYAPDGLEHGINLLLDFIEYNLSPEQVRKQSQSAVDSSRRSWKIHGKPGSRGAYRRPIRRSMTALDVVNAGAEGYIDSVRLWARSILDDLRSSGNLPK